MRRPTFHTADVARGERGSAYLATLLVLIVLTVLGLSLVLVTQIESEIGATERTIHRTFYAADSGIAAAVARKMSGGSGPFQFGMNGDSVGSLHRGDQVDVGNFFPVRIGFCNLCSANSGGEFHRIDYIAYSEAGRYLSGRADLGERHSWSRELVQTEIAIQPDRGPGDFMGLDKKSGARLGDRLADLQASRAP